MPRKAVKVMPEPVTVDGVTFTFQRNYCRQGLRRCNHYGWKFKDFYGSTLLILVCGSHATFPFDVEAFLAHPKITAKLERNTYGIAREKNTPTYQVEIIRAISGPGLETIKFEKRAYGLDLVLEQAFKGYPDLVPEDHVQITIRRKPQELVPQPERPRGWYPAHRGA